MNGASTLQRLTVALADRYRVDRELGAGGMATVYLAHDLRHERDVAIKVLHPDLGAALGADRFLAEIKTTAKLQHPHILPLLDSGEADGLLYYVMPFVRGETLRAKLDRERQLAIDEAVQIASEVGDALAAAHALGIVHRDIKPENILLQDGHALVADFGIALAVQSAGGQRMTQTGLSLGTPQYMSPEQAVGEKAVDARSDLYSLAAVTYEMLTGDPPFQGNNVQAIIARIISSEPEPVETLRKTVPVAIGAAVVKSLAKLPADRHADVRHYVAALRGNGSVGAAAASRIPVTRTANRGWWAVAVALAIVAAAGWWPRTPPSNADGTVAVSIELPEGTTTDNVGQPLAISPDGKTVVVAAADDNGSRRLYRRQLGQAGATPLEGTDDASYPAVSTDGAWVAFVARGKLMKVPLAGGPPRQLADVGTCYGLTWLASGEIIVSSGGRLARVSGDGGSLVPLPDAGSGAMRTERFPMALPDGRSVLYVEWISGIQSARVRFRRLDDGKATPFGADSIVPLGVVSGGVIAALPGGRLRFIPTSSNFARASGAPQPVLDGVQPWTNVAMAAISASGAIVYQPGSEQADLVLLDPVSRRSAVVSDVPRGYRAPRVSPDARRIASHAREMTAADIWITDIANRSSAPLTRTGGASRPEWTPDGARIYFAAELATGYTIQMQPWEGNVTSELIQTNANTARQAHISKDGRVLLYRSGTGKAAELLWRNLIGDTSSHSFASTPAGDVAPRWSPDGARIAWESDVSGVSQVYVASFPSAAGKVQVSEDGGEQPVWSRDGTSIYYVVNRGRMLVRATLAFNGDAHVSRRDTLVRSGYDLAYNENHANFDVAPDGRLALVRPKETGRFPILITDWRAASTDRSGSAAK